MLKRDKIQRTLQESLTDAAETLHSTNVGSWETGILRASMAIYNDMTQDLS